MKKVFQLENDIKKKRNSVGMTNARIALEAARIISYGLIAIAYAILNHNANQ